MLVRGRVRGVFFRDTCRREALARGLAGWVRNRSDGRVEAVFEGPPADVEAMVAWCRIGPRGGRVEGVDVLEAPVEGRTGFTIVAST